MFRDCGKCWSLGYTVVVLADAKEIKHFILKVVGAIPYQNDEKKCLIEFACEWREGGGGVNSETRWGKYGTNWSVVVVGRVS